MILDDIEKSAKPKKEVETININLGQSPLVKISLDDLLRDLDSIPDNQLYEILSSSYDTILNNVFIKNDIEYLSILTNRRVIVYLTDILGKVQINIITRTYCNKLVYDYITSLNDKDEDISDLLMDLSKVVNRDLIPIIIGLGINEELANTIVMSRFSSFKEIVNTKRLNTVLMNSPIEIMSEQTLVYIYERLYERMIPLFEGTMFDVIPDNNMNEESSELYSRISLAVLDILENMEMADIFKVITSYINDYYALFQSSGIRFSLRSLSGDFSRINYVVKSLESEGYVIP